MNLRGGGGAERSDCARFAKYRTSKKNAVSHFVNFALKIRKRKNLVLTKPHRAYLTILTLKGDQVKKQHFIS